MKDKVVSWFTKNLLMPEIEVIDNPGYILMKSARKQGYKRQVMMSESILAEIEDRAYEKDRENLLYSVGKKFGWRFTSMYNPPSIDDVSEKKFRRQVYFTVRFVGATYASDVDHEVDLETKKFELEAKNFVVCRNNGKGLLLLEGGIPGVWGYMLRDENIEAVKTECEGRGDEKCKVVSGPKGILENEHSDIFSETDLSNLGISKSYSKFNQKKETRYSEHSFRDFIDNGFFDYEKGIINHGEERYFLCEASLPYLLGSEMRDETSNEIVFDSAFKHGTKIAEQNSERKGEKFITEYLSACGWGDTRIKQRDGEYVVEAFLFPWTKFWEETSFPLYRGLVSGLLSGFADREVRLEDVEKDTKGRGFTVIVSE